MNKSLLIRQECPSDYLAVETLIESAFESLEISDKSEHLMVPRLRKSDHFIPELSLVAEQNDSIIGHILLTKIWVQDEHIKHQSLALAPVSVAPEYQKLGIGASLIRTAHEIAKSLGHTNIILIGHEAYYPRFGYEVCQDFGISFLFDVPKENAMILHLDEKVKGSIRGVVYYPKEFFGP